MATEKSMVKQFLQWGIFKNISQIIAIISVLGVGLSFVYTTRDTNNKLPELEQKVEENKVDYELDKAMFKDVLGEIKTEIKVLSTKVDDVKEYGQGKYHKETIDTIEIIKRHKGK